MTTLWLIIAMTILFVFNLQPLSSFRVDFRRDVASQRGEICANSTADLSFSPAYNRMYPPYHQQCYVRGEIIEIVNWLNFTVGVEIGVQKGIFSEQVHHVATSHPSPSPIHHSP